MSAVIPPLISGPLPDYLQPNLKILFVGINPGSRSALLGHHYAGPSNRFWKLLSESNLVSEPLTYRDDRRVLEWNIGLTNMVSMPSPGMATLRHEDYERGSNRLLALIHQYKPKVLALLGVTLFPHVFPKVKTNGTSGLASRRTRLGLQQETIGPTHTFVLPNPSGRNAHYSYQEMLERFCELKRWIETIPEREGRVR